MTELANPWVRLPSAAPFLLDEDAPVVHQFNRLAKPEHEIRFELLPEPFLGRPDAPVVLLNLNPGFCEDDIAHHSDPGFAALSRANLEHDVQDFPFYLLHPAVTAPGKAWWRKKLRGLIEVCGIQPVAQAVLCVEYAPYHSVRFGGPESLPSQGYGFHLVRSAMHRGALIIGMRSRTKWLSAIPELEAYERLAFLSNPQNPAISPGNCSSFDAAVAAIHAAVRAD